MKNKMKTITKINADGKEISSMDAADFLDSAIRKKESEKGTYSYGYKINNYVYRNYISNDAWTAFLQDLEDHYPSIYSSFQKGKGGEITQKGSTPPKMACSGSSSFFAIEQLKNIHNIEFEKELKKRVCKGINPQIDAFVKTEKTNIFVEAKCHEIYDKIHKGSKSYKKVYDSIGQGLKFDENTEIFSLKGATITSFDIKQIICHFLGICAEVLEDRMTTPTVRFIYIIYNPNAVKKYMTERQWSEVEGQYNKCKKEIDLFGDMKWLFDAIYKFQRENLTKKRLIKYSGECAFEFCVADQDDCLGYFTE